MLQMQCGSKVTTGHNRERMRYQGSFAGMGEAGGSMISRSLRWPIIGLAALICAGPAVGQEKLGKGKTPAQLFASDCSPCHKSPQGLAKSGGLFGLDGFLREHYTTSRESAAAIANYLRSMEAAGRPTKRATKGDEKKRPAAKTEAGKGAEKKPDAASEEPKPLGILAPEPKTSDTKANAPSAGDAKPAERKKQE
jgi:hypothetical protein